MTELARAGIDAVRQLAHKVIGAGGLERGDELRIRRLRAHHAQIVRDRAGKDGVALRYIAERRARGGRDRQALPVRPSEADAAVLRPDKAEHEADHRGLALAGRAGERHDLARAGAKVHMLEHRLAAGIGKGHVPQLHRARVRDRRRLARAGLLRQIGNGHEPAGGRRDGHGGRHKTDERRKRAAQHGRQLQEHHHRAVRDRVRPQPVNAPAEAAGRDEQADDRHHEPGNDRKAIVVQVRLAVFPLHGAHPVTKAVHDAERLDGREVAQRILVKRHDLAADILHAAVIAAHPAHERARAQHGQRRADERDERHDGIVAQDNDQRAEKLHRRRHETRQQARHAAGHTGDVGIEAVEQVAGAKLLERGPVGAQHAVIDLGLDAVLHADVDNGRDARRQRLHPGAAEQHAGHPGRGREDRPGLKAGDNVDERFHGHARQQRQRRAEDAEQNMDADDGAVAADVGEHPLCLPPHLLQRTVAHLLSDFSRDGHTSRPVSKICLQFLPEHRHKHTECIVT